MPERSETQAAPLGIDRRSFLRHVETGVAVAGAAWVLPSIASGNVAFAAGSIPGTTVDSTTTSTTVVAPEFTGFDSKDTAGPGPYSVTVPAFTALSYSIMGASGGSVPPRDNSGKGGKITGTIPASATSYTLSIVVGGQGGSGSGGGGGGSSSLMSGPEVPTPAVMIIAGGGGGGGGTGVSGGHGVSYNGSAWVGAGGPGGNAGNGGGPGGSGGIGGGNGGSGAGGPGGAGYNGGAAGGYGIGAGNGGVGSFFSGGGGGGYGGGGTGGNYSGGGGGGSVVSGSLLPTGGFEIGSNGNGSVVLTPIP